MKNYRVLIVDDIPELLKKLEYMVSNILTEWKIDKATNLYDAKRKIEDYTYQLIITDLMLNNDNTSNPEGIKLAEFTKKINPTCPIAVVSSYLKNFISNNQASQYHKLNLDFFDRTAEKDIFNELFNNYLFRILNQYNKFQNIDNLWEIAANTNKISYWIFFEGGGNHENDMISEVALWEKKCARFNTSLYISHPQDIYYKYLRDHFQISEFPALVFSNESSMSEYGLLKSNGITKLREVNMGLFNTMTKIHILMEQKRSMTKIKVMLSGKEFWDFCGQIFKQISFKDFLGLLGQFN